MNIDSSSKFTNNFIDDIIMDDINNDRVKEIHTRFPPEPNGYLHIGSAKAIWINSQAAKKYDGKFNLRYDDTNPVKEGDEYVQSILEDLTWLGAEPTGGIFYGSDYFDKCYEYAVKLIKDGKAFVCDLTKEELEEYKQNDRSEAGRPSPYRDRTVEENLDLFERMKNGEFPDGAKTLRAKIDPAAENTYLRDPVIYRIRHISHQRQGNKWCIYPMYDFAHPIQDATEGITHSLCSIEFRNHRPLYDWVIDNIGVEHKPHQYEFARLNVTYTVMSKRYLRYLVEHDIVDGWDDPRMPTICGLRRRGYTPSAIFDFVEKAGVSTNYSVADNALLEYCIREELNQTATRRIAVINPIKIVVDNYPDDKVEYFELPNNPNNPDAGYRQVPFTKELYIDADDFSENPPPKFFRLKPDSEVRLMGSYIIKCGNIEKDENGKIKCIHCTADLVTRNNSPTDRKIKGTIHWLSSINAYDYKCEYFNNLFSVEDVSVVNEDNFTDYINPNSIEKYNIKVEKALTEANIGDKFQFARVGYFTLDSRNPDTFLRIVSLKDSFKFNK